MIAHIHLDTQCILKIFLDHVGILGVLFTPKDVFHRSFIIAFIIMGLVVVLYTQVPHNIHTSCHTNDCVCVCVCVCACACACACVCVCVYACV